MRPTGCTALTHTPAARHRRDRVDGNHTPARDRPDHLSRSPLLQIARRLVCSADPVSLSSVHRWPSERRCVVNRLCGGSDIGGGWHGDGAHDRVLLLEQWPREGGQSSCEPVWFFPARRVPDASIHAQLSIGKQAHELVPHLPDVRHRTRGPERPCRWPPEAHGTAPAPHTCRR
jgi:hypothetical protein